MEEKYKILKKLKSTFYFDDYQVFIDKDSYEIVDSRCCQCKKEYYGVNFSGYVIDDGKKISYEWGTFSGYDSQCICDGGPVKQVLCTINRDNLESNNWMFLRYYVEDDMVDDLIKVLTKN
jgi:hypothetical protein